MPTADELLGGLRDLFASKDAEIAALQAELALEKEISEKRRIVNVFHRKIWNVFPNTPDKLLTEEMVKASPRYKAMIEAEKKPVAPSPHLADALAWLGAAEPFMTADLKGVQLLAKGLKAPVPTFNAYGLREWTQYAGGATAFRFATGDSGPIKRLCEFTDRLLPMIPTRYDWPVGKGQKDREQPGVRRLVCVNETTEAAANTDELNLEHCLAEGFTQLSAMLFSEESIGANWILFADESLKRHLYLCIMLHGSKAQKDVWKAKGFDNPKVTLTQVLEAYRAAKIAVQFETFRKDLAHPRAALYTALLCAYKRTGHPELLESANRLGDIIRTDFAFIETDFGTLLDYPHGLAPKHDAHGDITYVRELMVFAWVAMTLGSKVFSAENLAALSRLFHACVLTNPDMERIPESVGGFALKSEHAKRLLVTKDGKRHVTPYKQRAEKTDTVMQIAKGPVFIGTYLTRDPKLIAELAAFQAHNRKTKDAWWWGNAIALLLADTTP